MRNTTTKFGANARFFKQNQQKLQSVEKEDERLRGREAEIENCTDSNKRRRR